VGSAVAGGCACACACVSWGKHDGADVNEEGDAVFVVGVGTMNRGRAVVVVAVLCSEGEAGCVDVLETSVEPIMVLNARGVLKLGVVVLPLCNVGRGGGWRKRGLHGVCGIGG